MLNNILGHITDDAMAYAIVSRLMDALCSGSYLSLNDGTNVIRGKEFEEAIRVWNQASSVPSACAASSRSLVSSTVWNSWNPV